jgi:hypothetical protein
LRLAQLIISVQAALQNKKLGKTKLRKWLNIRISLLTQLD